MPGRRSSIIAAVLVSGVLTLAAPAHAAPTPAAPTPAAFAPAAVDATVLAAYRHGVPVVEAVRFVSEDETTIGVIYRTVHDPAQLTSATDKYLVLAGVPPAPEFLVLTHPTNSGTMYSLDGAGQRRDQLPGRFTLLPDLTAPDPDPVVGVARITD